MQQSEIICAALRDQGCCRAAGCAAARSANARTTSHRLRVPPSDELVLVSGVPPKRAHKTRYYQDIWLKSRVLSPPALVTTSAGPSGDRPATHADDWTTLAPPPRTSLGGYSRVGRRFLADDDPANGGIRREPTLPEHEAIASEQAKPSPESRCSKMSPTMTRSARRR